MVSRAVGSARLAGATTGPAGSDTPGRPVARSCATPAANPESHCSVDGSSPSTTRNSNSVRSGSSGPSGRVVTVLVLIGCPRLPDTLRQGDILGSRPRWAERPGSYRLITWPDDQARRLSPHNALLRLAVPPPR